MRLPLWSQAQVRLMARDRESDDAGWALTEWRCRTRVLFGRVGGEGLQGALGSPFPRFCPNSLFPSQIFGWV